MVTLQIDHLYTSFLACNIFLIALIPPPPPAALTTAAGVRPTPPSLILFTMQNKKKNLKRWVLAVISPRFSGWHVSKQSEWPEFRCRVNPYVQFSVKTGAPEVMFETVSVGKSHLHQQETAWKSHQRTSPPILLHLRFPTQPLPIHLSLWLITIVRICHYQPTCLCDAFYTAEKVTSLQRFF